MERSNDKRALVSGASFAGLCTAYWMNKFGYKVTIVELAPGLKKGGTPVNILEKTIDVVKRMGIFDQINANRLTMERMEFKDSDDVTQYLAHQGEREHEEYEIERDVLLELLYDLIKDDVEFVFSDTVTALEEQEDQVLVGFKKGTSQLFDLVFGCDGIHSVIRNLWFGSEKEFSHFLQTYFSITIVDKLLIPENTTQMYSEVGKTVMLNAYNGKTDICFAYFAEEETTYDYRNEVQMRDMIYQHFKTSGWRSAELLEEVRASEVFYFDKLCQMKMTSWTKGRIALVGDAGYCASPAAGRGGSLAIDGAAALAEAFEKFDGNFEQAFKEYNDAFSPFVDTIQTEAQFGLETLIPKTEEAIIKRNREGFNFLVSSRKLKHTGINKTANFIQLALTNRERKPYQTVIL